VNPDCTHVFECKPTDLGSMLDVTVLQHPACSPNAVCYTADMDNPVCACKEGFTGDGHTCEEMEEPEPGPETIGPNGCKCQISGDPHIMTFDEAHLELSKTCKYVLSSSPGATPECAYRVEAKNERRPNSAHPLGSYVRLLDIRLGLGLNKVVRLHTHDLVYVDGQSVDLPLSLSGGVSVILDGPWMNLTTDCGLHVSFDGHGIGVVQTSQSYRMRMTGLCGNCNDLRGDDLKFEGLNVRDFLHRNVGSEKLAHHFLTLDDSDLPDSSDECQVT